MGEFRLPTSLRRRARHLTDQIICLWSRRLVFGADIEGRKQLQ